MMKISDAYGLAILVLVIVLAFTTPDNGVLLAIRAFAIFAGLCAVAWSIIGLNSSNPADNELYISPRQIPYTPHSSQTIVDFVKAGRK